MYNFILGAIFIALCADLSAQVGIGTADPQRELDINGHLRIRDLSETGNSLTGGKMLFTEGDGTVVGLEPDGIEVNNNSVTIFGGRYYKIATVDVGAASGLNNLDLDLDGANVNASVIILTGSSGNDIVITGIQGGTDGRHLIIINDFEKKITIEQNDGDSFSANRIEVKTTLNYTNDNIGTLELVYDGTANRWILFRLNN